MYRSQHERIRVLFVSGDEAATDRATSHLEERDPPISVTTVHSPGQALERVATVDCVVSEHDLPGTDGLSFLGAVRDRDETMPFVLAPASGSEWLASDAIAAGVTEYVPREGDELPAEAVAAAVADAVSRPGTRHHAAAMERIVSVLKDVDAALVHATTRAELERAVCAVFADSDPYQFAWIGAYDPEAHSLEPRASAGVESDFLEKIPVGEGETLPDYGPGPEAIATGTLQVTQNVHEDEAFDPYEDEVDAVGFRSVATVPLAHDDGLYGLLAVYADRVNAFDERERDLLSSIGDDIGYAIAAIETRTDRRRFRQAVDSAGQAIGVTASDGTIEYVNPTFEEQTGYAEDAVVGRKLADVLDVSPDAVRAVDATPEDLGWERQFVATTADGETYHAEQTITPITGAGGRVDGFVIVQAAITARIEREAALRTETEMLNSLFETSPIGIVVVSPDGTIRRANDRAASILELPPERVTGRSIDEPEWTFVDEDGDEIPDSAHPFNRVREGDASPYAAEVRMDRPHADPIWLSIRGARLVGPEGDTDGFVFTFEDVTESKTRERELRSFKMAVEHAAHCIYVTDADGTIEYVNPAFEEQTGYDRTEAIGETPALLNSGVHDEAFFEEMWETILGGDVWEREIVNQRKDGTLVHVEQSVAPVVGEDGEIDQFVAINQDITDRKEYQLQLERQNERLESFASVLSHDLRNPLNVAAGRLELSEASDEHLAVAADALDRMAAIIDDVLTLAREGTTVESTEPVDLESAASEAWTHVPGDAATLEIDAVPTIAADRQRVHRILENLFRNAVDHGAPEDGGSSLTVRLGHLDDGFYVEDDGTGIPAAERDRVFESGYTRSPSGTGLGLAIVRELAGAHGWDVDVAESEAGGARFEFTGVDTAGGTGE